MKERAENISDIRAQEKDEDEMDGMRGITLRLRRFWQKFLDLVMGFLFSLVYHGPGERMPPIDDLTLLESASSLAYKIRTKKVKSETIVQSFIERIKQVNPILNCVIDNRFETALEEARKVDQLIASGTKTEEQLATETPFLGVPFSTKDSISVEGCSHTAGLYKRRNVRAEKDADVIHLMRKAGGIPFAITNISELCMWWESHNKVYGRTNNPYNTNHIVGGSSGGEACLLAAAGSPMGIGSDIGGSIRMPAYFNGIFGHKPTTGIVSSTGSYPVAAKERDYFLQLGPISRYSADLIPMFKVLAAENVNKLQLDSKVDIRNIKFYYMEDDGGSFLSDVHPEVKLCIKRMVIHLDKAYGIKAQKVNIKNLKSSAAIWLAKMKGVEGVPLFSEELNNREGNINVYWELLKWFLFLSNHTLIGLCTALVEKWGVEPGSPRHVHLVNKCTDLFHELKDLMGEDGVFLYPTHPTPAPFHNEPLMKPFNFAYTAIINVLGFPATQVPMGLSTKGLPVGIQVVGGLYNDHLTLAVASEMEKAFGGWVPPSITV